MRSFLLLAAALSFIPSTAVALTFSAPLNDLVGGLDYPGGFKEATFDFGQQFSAIESVSIEVEAQVFALQLDFCGTTTDPQPCVLTPLHPGFFVIMDEEDQPFLGIISSGLSYSDDPLAFEGSGTDVAGFNNSSPTGWDLLLDGEGSLTLFWSELLLNPDGQILAFREAASGEIFGARLIIEGTPIPEPSTALLLATGLLALAGTRPRT